MRTIAVFALFFAFAALPVEAHVFKHFETLSVLLHMEPGDDPIAGEPAQLFFYFSDKADDPADRFRVSRCECRVKISENGSVLYDKPLIGEVKNYGEEVRIANFTFPRKGLYAVELEAREPSHPPFTLQYDVRIERGNDLPAGTTVPWKWIAGMAGVLLLGVALGYGLLKLKHA